MVYALPEQQRRDLVERIESRSGLRQLETLADPLNKITLARELDENLTLYRATVPIGVIGVIFEARPDALVQMRPFA